MKPANNLKSALILTSGIALMACDAQVSSDAGEDVMVETSEPVSCEQIEQVTPAGITITQAQSASASDDIPVNHCIVQGQIQQRTGEDGNSYAISFELRLPDDWSGRFLHQFNGGNDGTVVPALGRLGVFAENDSALARGFAVVSSDAGHDGSAHPESGLAGANIFGLEFESRKDYGYDAVVALHPAAMELTEAYYQAPIQFTYGMGSSNGGRHAMIAASRMGDQFDGLVAGYPGFNLPKAGIQHAWDLQAFRSTGNTLQQALSREELNIVAQHVLSACDRLDGIEDGLIFDTLACQSTFEPSTMSCSANMTNSCLPAEKVNVLAQILSGPKNSVGEQLYSEWAWDTGLASGNWRAWKLESGIPPWNGQPIIAVMGAGSLAQVFTTPPTPLGGSSENLEQYLLDFDFDVDAPKINATSDQYPESAMQLMTPPDAESPTLATLDAEGGKLLIFHGVSDPVFSFLDTVNWYENLKENKPDANDFVVLYGVPGMPHGPGGSAADQFDPLSKITEWVENGIAPGTITATVREDNQEAPEALRGSTRKLCQWPAVSRYIGPDPSSADSFACSTTLR